MKNRNTRGPGIFLGLKGQRLARATAALGVLGLLVALGASVRLQAQNSTVPSPAVRVTTRLVLVDAVVRSKDGKVLTGLKPKDFTVLEDGRPQKVSMFLFERPAEISQSLIDQRRSLPPNVTTDRPAYRVASGPPVIILLDALNTSQQAQSKARMEMLKYLGSQLKPGQPVAVYTLGDALRLLQDFTDNPTLLKAAVEKFNPTQPVEQQISKMEADMPQTPSSGGETSLRGRFSTSVALSRAFSVMQDFYEEEAAVGMDERVGMTLSAFQAISHDVAGIPGRKTLVWVTGSFPLATYQLIRKYSADAAATASANRLGLRELYSDQVDETASMLSNAQVAVYPVDARGLIGELQGGAENQRQAVDQAFGQELQQASANLQDTQGTMQLVAEDTGGKVFTNRNDLAHAVALSVQDGNAYYLLGYTPPGKADGKFHKIEVKVDRPDVTVRARRGYYATRVSENKKTAKQLDAQVGMAMQLEAPLATGVTFDARVMPPKPSSKMKVPVDFLVDPRTVTVEDSKSLALEFHVAAYGEKGKLAAHEDLTIKPTLTAGQYAAIEKQGIPFRVVVELKPGTYMLRLGVVDEPSETIGTADLQLVLPAPK